MRRLRLRAGYVSFVAHESRWFRDDLTNETRNVASMLTKSCVTTVWTRSEAKLRS